MTQADACQTVTDLRARIDAIDAALLDLLAQRAACIDRAIVLKRRENLPARTSDRVAQVIAGVRAGALARGLDPDLIEGLWRALIEAAITHEARALGEGEPGFPNPARRPM